MFIALAPAARPGVKRLCNCRLTASARICTNWFTSPLLHLLPFHSTPETRVLFCTLLYHLLSLSMLSAYMLLLLKIECILPSSLLLLS